jgi:NADPH:quinone reductase-like Zn-dependent oxidoreductase
MRAFALDDFATEGSLRDLPEPKPAEGEVEVRVKASSLNAMDWKVAKGYMKDYMEHRFPLIPGLAFSGVVEATGPGVEGLKKGDAVFGAVGKPYQGAGAFAEFATASAAAIVPKPASLDDVVAATLPIAGTTALQAIEEAQLQPGDTVLIVGASGGVGSFATELAAQRGARVLAVGRSENTDYLKGLGAAEVIDYREKDVTQEVRRLAPEKLAAVIDLVSDGPALEKLTDLVRDRGIVISALGAAPQESAPRGIRGFNLAASLTRERLTQLASLLERGELQPPALQRYKLEQAASALQEAATGHVKGKVVVTVD